MALIAVTTDHVAYEHGISWDKLDSMTMSEIRTMHRFLHIQTAWEHRHQDN